MKKTILTIALFSISLLNAQNSVSSSNSTINGNRIIGNSIENIIAHFSSPNSIEDYFYETDDIMTQKYIYDGLTLYVHNNKVVDFNITSSAYNFTKNNLKIGALVSTIDNFYPLSYRKRTNNALTIRFSDIDKFITVLYDEQQKINEIRTGAY